MGKGIGPVRKTSSSLLTYLYGHYTIVDEYTCLVIR